jgi:Ser/Thr protein kinase RdoA (MazF antagonist)
MRFAKRLKDLFGVSDIQSIQEAPGGLLCQNFLLRTGQGSFFLKQYRNKFSGSVSEIKFSEQFFATHNVPVILPIRDRLDRPAFFAEENWYSLFPFVNGAHPNAHAFAEKTIMDMGALLARIHLIGTKVPSRTVQPLRIFTNEAFRVEYLELKDVFEQKSVKRPAYVLAMKRLEQKAAYVAEHANDPVPELLLDCLLHGDFIYPNLFVDENGEITHVFDFEKTAMGPRSYELARSLMINCFDFGWGNREIECAQKFLRAYMEIYPITFEEFFEGMALYRWNFVHMTWVEGKILLQDSDDHLSILRAQSKRIQHYPDDLEAFCRSLYPSS